MNMWGLIFNRKKGGAPAPAPEVAAKPPPPPPRPPAPPPPPKADASERLAAAQGNDEALLALARDAGIQLAQRLAALEGLEAEAVLKQAEREFREHDRRLHQAAKRRLQAKVATRQAREQAGQLIEAARALLDEPDAPVNRAVALDHAWQALDATLLEAGQREAFAALSAQLAGQSRQRSEVEAQRKRRRAALQQALPPLQAACRAAAEGTLDRAGLAAAIAAAQSEADAPTPAGLEGPLTALQQALQTAAALDGQLALLETLLARPDDEAAHAAWQQREALPDAALASLLQARHVEWQQQRDRERQQLQAQGRQQQRQRQQAQRVEQQAALAETLTQVEAALEAGQLADAQRQLTRIDRDLRGSPAPEALQARLAAAQARLAQLRGWQHWSGGRARDELVAQAEALAAATVAGADAADPEVARLSIKQRSEVIATLRARWKEIDQLGGAGGRALWPRFDAALKAAHEPVAAHHAAQKAAREANLAARNELLDALEAETRAETDAAPEPRQLATALERFQIGWRKLGPLEHTVPRAAQAALTARLQAAQAQAEQPLQSARTRARAEREALITRARALGSAGRDLVAEARALQAEWQTQARALPLARGDEQTLWTEFKGAIDAAFAARQQAFDAREAELEVHASERAALIARLQLRPEDSPAAQRRLLAEVDAAWNRCGPAPRARAAALEAEYHAARQVLRQWLDSAAERDWQARCDAWEARLAQQASGTPPVDADELLLQIETAWELPTPPAFEAARRQRKLLAMKAALEGRRAAPAGPAPEQALASLLDCPQLEDAQRARLAAIVAAQRRRGPQRAA